MVASVAVGRRADPLASRSRSRTTSDFEILRPRDSASMSATSGSGKRTVSVFMRELYYIHVSDARRCIGPYESMIAIPLANVSVRPRTGPPRICRKADGRA
jgi:hypothetical protein